MDEESEVHKDRASCAFPLPKNFNILSFSLHSAFFCDIFSFSLLGPLLLYPVAPHDQELHQHSASELYCLPFLVETCPPGWVPLFLSDINLFLIFGSVLRIWLPYMHLFSCIYGCIAVVSACFQVRYSSWVVAVGRESGKRLFICFFSRVHRVTQDKTVPLFVVTIVKGLDMHLY